MGMAANEWIRADDELQLMRGIFAGDELRTLTLPPAKDEVMPGVTWGHFDVIGTAAFWAGRMWLMAETNTPAMFRLGSTLAEEVVACLLGGHGMPAAVGLAAFERLRSQGLAEGVPAAAAIELHLREPLQVRGRQVRYRFPKQRAAFIAGSLERLAQSTPPSDDVELRDFLNELPGIGPKTASWITRNWTASDRVAIIDIHIQRAGTLAGFFRNDWTPGRHYRLLEERFLAFAKAIDVRPCLLDNLMWDEMRTYSRMLSTV